MTVRMQKQKTPGLTPTGVLGSGRRAAFRCRKTRDYTMNGNTSPRDGAAVRMASRFFNMVAIVLLSQSTCSRWGYRFGVE